MTKKLNLLVTVATPTKVFIDKVMTLATKSLPITNGISKIWVLPPRLNMVNDCLVATSERFIAVLAGGIVPSDTKVTPLNVQDVISPLNVIAEVKLRITTLSVALLFISAFVATRLRAESPSIGVILITPVCLATFFTVLVKSGLLHGIMLAGIQHEIK